MDAHPILTIRKYLQFKNETEDDVIGNFISNPSTVTPYTCDLLNFVIDKSDEEEFFYETVTHDIPITSSIKGVLV